MPHPIKQRDQLSLCWSVTYQQCCVSFQFFPSSVASDFHLINWTGAGFERYSKLAGTNVLTDFVELPSQLMEHWLGEPQVLKEFALHHETGEQVPDALIAKLKAAQTFNQVAGWPSFSASLLPLCTLGCVNESAWQGFDTIEYTACALVDMALHLTEDFNQFDLKSFEDQELARLGMPQVPE